MNTIQARNANEKLQPMLQRAKERGHDVTGMMSKKKFQMDVVVGTFYVGLLFIVINISCLASPTSFCGSTTPETAVLQTIFAVLFILIIFLARRFSRDKSSKKGGSIGWRNISQFSDTIQTALKKTKVGLNTKIDVGRGRVHDPSKNTRDSGHRVRIHCVLQWILTRAMSKPTSTRRMPTTIFSHFDEATRHAGSQDHLVY